MQALPKYRSRTYCPSAHINRLRERVLAQPAELFADIWYRPYYYLEGWQEAGGQLLG